MHFPDFTLLQFRSFSPFLQPSQLHTRPPSLPPMQSTMAAITLSQIAPHHRALNGTHTEHESAAPDSFDGVASAALAMMKKGNKHDNINSYLAARFVFVDRFPGRMEKEREFVDAVWKVCPRTGVLLANVRVVSLMLLLQNDDEDNGGFVESLCRYICDRARTQFRFPMFRFKLHALRHQASTEERHYEHIFSDRDMGVTMLFMDEILSKLEDRGILYIDDQAEEQNATEIAQEVYGDIGLQALAFEPFTHRLYYNPEAHEPQLNWYDCITHRYARPILTRKRPRPGETTSSPTPAARSDTPMPAARSDSPMPAARSDSSPATPALRPATPTPGATPDRPEVHEAEEEAHPFSTVPSEQ